MGIVKVLDQEILHLEPGLQGFTQLRQLAKQLFDIFFRQVV